MSDENCEAGYRRAGRALEWLAALADGEPGYVRPVTGTPGAALTLDGMIERDIAGDGAVFYLLACRECGNGDPVMPFTSPAGRGKWAGEHTRRTGHDRWFVTDTARLRAEAGTSPGFRRQAAGAMARNDELLRRLAGGTLKDAWRPCRCRT